MMPPAMMAPCLHSTSSCLSAVTLAISLRKVATCTQATV